jgi:hypothetical protein
MSLIQLYRDLTVVELGDGGNTCFWLDTWLENKPLSIQYSALFSHVQNPNLSVADCYNGAGWQIRLRHITSQQAEAELTVLLNNIDNVSSSTNPDRRFLRFGSSKHFSVKGCYCAMNFGGTTCIGNREIWNSLAPKKCKIFAWLALHNCLSTRDRLARRGVNDEATCPFGCQTEETLEHLLFRCPHSSPVWGNFHIQNGQDRLTLQGAVTSASRAPAGQRKEWGTFLVAIAWNIWLARNRKVFDNVAIPSGTIMADCMDTINLWANQCRNAPRREAIKAWVADNRSN